MDQELQEELNGAETIERVADIYETLILYNCKDFEEVNKSIIDRWGMDGLVSAKEKAWYQLACRDN